MCNQSEAVNNRTQWQKSSPLKLLGQVNQHLVESIYGRSSMHNSNIVNKHGCHRQFLFMIGRSLKNLLLWNPLAKWTKAWLKASMEGLLCSLLILSRSVYKLGRQRHLLFLVCRFLKISSPLMPLVQMNRNLVGSIYWRSSIQIANFVPIS